MTLPALSFCFACTSSRLTKVRRVFCMTHDKEVFPSETCASFQPFMAEKLELLAPGIFDQRRSSTADQSGLADS